MRRALGGFPMRHHVKFGRPPFRWSLRRRLHFLGKGTIHFEETGILLGGDVLKFRLPFVDLFYQKLIADHGTRTIPYSTIVRHRQVPYWPTMLVKALLLIILTASLTVIVWAFLRHGHSLGVAIAASVVVLLALGVLLLGRRYHDLTFRLPDDGRCRVHFSVRQRRESKALCETLERYMAAAESSALTQTQLPATETVRGQTNRGGCPRCGQPLPTGAGICSTENRRQTSLSAINATRLGTLGGVVRRCREEAFGKSAPRRGDHEDSSWSLLALRS